jgi:hypothetical protein
MSSILLAEDSPFKITDPRRMALAALLELAANRKRFTQGCSLSTKHLSPNMTS